MKSVQPTLFIGLGEYGKEVVDKTLDLLQESDPVVFDHIIADYCIGNDGTFKSRHKYVSDLAINNVSSKFGTVEIIQRNYNTLLDHERELRQLFEELLKNIREISANSQLIANGYEKSNIQVFITSTLFDPIGSAFIIPVIKILKRIDPTLIINMLLQLPNCSDEKNVNTIKKQKFRAYASITELEQELVKTNIDGFVFLVGVQNESGSIVDSTTDLLSAISYFTYLFTLHKVNSERSNFQIQRTNIFSSLGLSSIVYPRDRLKVALLNRSAAEVYGNREENIQARIEMKWDYNLVNQSIKRFIADNEFKNYENYLSEDENQEDIFQPIVVKNDLVSADKRPEDFYTDFEKQLNEYRLGLYGESLSKLSKRKEQLSEQSNKSIMTAIFNEADNLDKGLAYSEAFLCNFVDKASIYVDKNILPDQVENLHTIKSTVFEFFERYLNIHEMKSRSSALQKEIDQMEQEIKE